jgi:glycosyltransferase involved in cell wall biosynthesis
VHSLKAPRVAIVSEEFPPYMMGGTGTMCNYLARGLSKKGISTTVFSGKSAKPTVEIVDEHLKVIRLPSFDFPPRFAWFQLQNFANIVRRLKDYTLVHAITPEVSPICIYLKKKLGIPLITSYHGFTKYEVKSFINVPLSNWTVGEFGYYLLGYPMYEIVTRLSLASSDHAISCSHVILNELRMIYGDSYLKNCSVIYNGIDFEEIDDVERNCATQVDNENPTLIYYGRLYWLKGLMYLVKAFKILAHDYSNLGLKIFGKGPLKNRVQKLTSDLGLADRVQFLGQIPHKELVKEIMKADVAVLPSLREAQPLSVLEAMACKKPVVAFDLPFANEYIKDSYNGLLAKPENSEDLAHRIAGLLDDEQSRIRVGLNAYYYVRKNHNWADLIEKYIEVYERVICT